VMEPRLIDPTGQVRTAGELEALWHVQRTLYPHVLAVERPPIALLARPHPQSWRAPSALDGPGTKRSDTRPQSPVKPNPAGTNHRSAQGGPSRMFSLVKTFAADRSGSHGVEYTAALAAFALMVLGGIVSIANSAHSSSSGAATQYSTKVPKTALP
jgi:Flp pilus assembly pilin Flp